MALPLFHGILITPLQQGGFYWKDSVSVPAVKYIIPGGTYHEKYKSILQTIGSLAKSIKGKDGKLVPMIFRPYHEFDGDWFWWGKSHCTMDEFTTLWKFTVSYLRDSLGVHNFIYAFSPDNKYNSEAEYLERYPGDEWVDILGVDNYGDWGRDGNYNLEAGIKKLKSFLIMHTKREGSSFYGNRIRIYSEYYLVDRNTVESTQVKQPSAGLCIGLAERCHAAQLIFMHLFPDR